MMYYWNLVVNVFVIVRNVREINCFLKIFRSILSPQNRSRVFAVKKVRPRFELGSLDSESKVLTIKPWDLVMLFRHLCRIAHWMRASDFSDYYLNKIFGSLPFVPPPSTLCAPQLQSTCHYIVNHYVKILHVRLGGANNMRPLSWGGGGGAQTEKIQIFKIQFLK